MLYQIKTLQNITYQTLKRVFKFPASRLLPLQACESVGSLKEEINKIYCVIINDDQSA